MIFRIVLPLMIAIYIPMFGTLVPFIRTNFPFNLVKLSIVILILVLLIDLPIKKRIKLKLDKYSKLLIIYNLLYILFFIIKGFLDSDLLFAINYIHGHLLSLFIIIFICTRKEFGLQKKIFDTIFFSISILFIVQLIISVLESANGYLFGEYEINIIGTLENRDILSIFNLSQASLFGFSIPFTGMIGQHNGYGIMLIFYNLLFIFYYRKEPSRYKIVLLILVIFALIGNGTRSALFIVILTDYLFIIRNSNLKRKVIFLLSFLVLGFYYSSLVRVVETFYYQSDTMLSRIMLWQALFDDYIKNATITTFFFGLSFNEISRIGEKIIGVVGSVESEFFRNYLHMGFGGVILYVITFSFVGAKSQISDNSKSVSLKIFMINIMFISFFMTGITYYASYSLITLIILFNAHEEFILKSKREQSNVTQNINNHTLI